MCADYTSQRLWQIAIDGYHLHSALCNEEALAIVISQAHRLQIDHDPHSVA
jgi:hypothetical protein